MKPNPRGIFCNRTLNLQAIKAIGYDMDYTLIHYNVEAWEQRAYEYLREKLADAGWPVVKLTYQPDFVIRGLIIDLKLGNLVKANRFGYVKRAFHGTRRLGFDEQRKIYARTLVDLSGSRWVFLNTFFSLSEACMYAQLVDLLDRREIEDVLGYDDLHRAIRRGLDETHLEGRLKQEIIEDPKRFVQADAEAPLALLDQREAGKRLVLITNSEWPYVRDMMALCFDPYLPDGMSWRDLFEMSIVSARKPHFFTTSQPLFELASEDGLLRPTVGAPTAGGIYVGGSARTVETYLGLSGSRILYVGDHLYTDVRITKNVLRWRSALIVRELEGELSALANFAHKQDDLDRLMAEKEAKEQDLARGRLDLQRLARRYGPKPERTRKTIKEELDGLNRELTVLDEKITPLAVESGKLFNPIWGLLWRTGADKSSLARQVERYADIYTSRISNFMHCSPYAFLRPPKGSLPHEPR